jgi:hypothetical protein
MAEEPGFDARSIVDAIYDEAADSKILDLLGFIEEEIRRRGFIPTYCKFSDIFTLIAADAVMRHRVHGGFVED